MIDTSHWCRPKTDPVAWAQSDMLRLGEETFRGHPRSLPDPVGHL
jgi:hypothetical protein